MNFASVGCRFVHEAMQGWLRVTAITASSYSAPFHTFVIGTRISDQQAVTSADRVASMSYLPSGRSAPLVSYVSYTTGNTASSPLWNSQSMFLQQCRHHVNHEHCLAATLMLGTNKSWHKSTTPFSSTSAYQEWCLTAL